MNPSSHQFSTFSECREAITEGSIADALEEAVQEETDAIMEEKAEARRRLEKLEEKLDEERKNREAARPQS